MIWFSSIKIIVLNCLDRKNLETYHNDFVVLLDKATPSDLMASLKRFLDFITYFISYNTKNKIFIPKILFYSYIFQLSFYILDKSIDYFHIKQHPFTGI